LCQDYRQFLKGEQIYDYLLILGSGKGMEKKWYRVKYLPDKLLPEFWKKDS
jgi:hypothetical protein